MSCSAQSCLRGPSLSLLAITLALSACVSIEGSDEPDANPDGDQNLDIGLDSTADARPDLFTEPVEPDSHDEPEAPQPFCGDEAVDEGEECDDGNAVDDDRCADDCLLNPAEPCLPCAADDDCGRASDLCFDQVDGLFCGRDCTEDDCDEGFECVEVVRDEAVVASQCAPLTGYCGDCPDGDEDSVCDAVDRCVDGDDRIDVDEDGVPDDCDECPNGDNTADLDSDGVPDGCDLCMGGNDVLDDDEDLVPDFCDRCPGSDDQVDADADTVPDDCDVCSGGDDTLDADLDDRPDHCDCDASGDRCDVNADCFDGLAGVVCDCRDGWSGTGEVCSDVDECLDAPCHADAECSNEPGTYSCACLAGFEGDGFECTDIDECDEALDDCDVNASCSNDPGSYTCTCNDGWIGSGLECSDVDECDTGEHTCHDHAECTNTLGGFDCACSPGFEGDGFVCSDVNECSRGLDNCDDDANCSNTAGSFVCSCPAGLSGNGIICYHPAPVLIYHDDDDSRADEAAAALGLPRTYTTSTAEFFAAFDDGGYGLVVVDAPANTISAAFRDRLTTWVHSGGRLVLSYWNLDADQPLRSLLGLGSVEDYSSWRDVYVDPGAPVRLFDLIESVPSPLTGTDLWSDNGDELTLGGAGFLTARFDSAIGPGAIAVTNEGRAIVNGFLMADALTSNTDGDSRADVEELLINELALALDDPACQMFEGFEEGSWPIGLWAQGKLETLYPGTVEAASAHDGGFGINNVGWYYAPSIAVGQPGDRIVAWVRNGAGTSGRVYLGFGATSTGARSFVFAPNTDQLLFQVNDDYNYLTATSQSQTFAADTWYRLEIEYTSTTTVRGTLFDATNAQVRTMTHNFGTTRAGGVAIRAFQDAHVDSLVICRP